MNLLKTIDLLRYKSLCKKDLSLINQITEKLLDVLFEMREEKPKQWKSKCFDTECILDYFFTAKDDIKNNRGSITSNARTCIREGFEAVKQFQKEYKSLKDVVIQ